MKKIIAIITPVLLSMTLLTSCEDEIKVTTGDIIGNVSDQTTGEPVPTANVKLEPSGRSVVTGRDGNFQFSQIEGDSSYTVSITKEGYNSASRNVRVVPGQTAEVNFTIERIPAVVTVDRDVLDFGDGSDVNTLSFNIVNAGYEDLEWTIEYDCPWIKQVKDDRGVLKHGKTQTIVIFIDREKLNDGDNRTIVVVKSSNGSSELTVTAIGEGKREVTLNTLDVKDIAGKSAVFNGEIIDAGHPQYTERGFVYSHENNPTKETSIEVLTAKMTDEKTFSINVKNLDLNTEYYVRAYAESPMGLFYSSNTVKFSTSGRTPVIHVLDVSDMDLDKKTVVLNGAIEFQGEPPYTERGFVYADKNNPTIYDNIVISKGEGEGEFSEKISGLELGVKYYVRAYVKWNEKIHYSQTSAVFTTEGSKAEVSIHNVTNIDLTTLSATFNGSIDNPGTPEYTERGFVYGNSHGPTVNDTKIIVAGKGEGEYSAYAEGLVLNEKYYVKAYVINDAGIAYSHDEVSFETVGNSDLELSAAQLDFGTDKSEMSLDIKNIGNIGDISWEVASISESWLQVLPSSGNLGMGRSATLKVLVDRESITHSKQTAFTINAAGKEYVVTVKVGYQSTGDGDNEGGDSQEGTITSEDSRIIGELTSVKRNGTTVTIEYTLLNDGLGNIDYFYIYTCAGSYNDYTKIFDERFYGYKNATFTFNDKTADNSNTRFATRFPEKVKTKGKIVIKDFAETSQYVNIEMRVNANNSDMVGNNIVFKNIKVDGAILGDTDETDGKDYSNVRISTGDDRIEAKILSCRRNGTTVTLEYYLRNSGLGNIQHFYMYTCAGSYNNYTKIYDENQEYYKNATFTFNDAIGDNSKTRFSTRFPDKIKVIGKIVIKDFAETSGLLNVRLRIEASDADLAGNDILFENIPVENVLPDEDDGIQDDFSSATISTGDDRINAEILKCKRNGSTVTLEYYLQNHGLGDIQYFYMYTCSGAYDNYSQIHDEEYNSYNNATFTFNDTSAGNEFSRLTARFPEVVKVHGKIVITDFAETSEKLNVRIRIEASDVNLDSNDITFENVTIY